MSRKNNDPWVRTFSVTDPVRHKKGYTLYKVISKVFPKNSIEAVTQVTVWKRYNDFKKLHKALYALHQSLYLKGTFPVFAKARYFGRFEDHVIEERRKCALELLEFAAKHPPLFTSQVFVKFFETDQIENLVEIEEKCLEPVLQPTSVTCANISSTNTSSLSGPSDDVNLSNTLGGIWQHHQVPDEISISSQNATEGEDEEDDRTTFTDDDPSTSRVAVDLSEFDPILELSTSDQLENSLSRSEVLCNDWLLSAFHSCATVKSEKDDSDSALVFPTPFGNFVDLEPKLDADDQISSGLQDAKLNAIESECDMASDLSTFDPLNNAAACSNAKNSVASGELTTSEILTATYILKATQAVIAAQHSELSGNIFGAFTLYKTAVDILLTGIQTEEYPNKNEVVRRKIAQYMKRADELYEDHLLKEKQQNGDVIKIRNQPLDTVSEKPCDHHLRKPVADLAKYRVIGIFGQVILVVDAVSDSTRVVKVLRKSSYPQQSDAPNIAPRGINFMVELYEMYETRDAIFLILEYASGGRLWEYIGTYLQHNSPHQVNECDQVFTEHVNQADFANIYSAKKTVVDSIACDQVICENTVQLPVKVPSTASGDPDLTAESECHSGYVALFKNYLISAHSEKNDSLAQINIAVSAHDVNGVHEDSRQSLQEKSTAVESYDIAEESNSASGIFHLCSSKNDSELNGSNNSFTAAVELRENQLIPQCLGSSTDSKAVQAIIQNSKTLMKSVDDVLCSTKCSPSPGIRKGCFGSNLVLSQPDVMDHLGGSSSLKSSKSAAELQSFICSDDVEIFLNLDGKVKRKDFCSSGLESEQSSTLKHLASSTGGLDLRPSVTEAFHQMDVVLAMSKTVHLPDTCIALWAAEITSALDSLHKLGIIWQDLNPDNILLGKEGHILLTYKSSWNCVDNMLNENAKRNLYAAPEVGNVFPVSQACDWWSLGAVVFELLTGTKLVSCHPCGITSHTNLNIPDDITHEAEDLLKQLLRYNESERLGSGPHGVEDIKFHPFFHSVDWDVLNVC